MLCVPSVLPALLEASGSRFNSIALTSKQLLTKSMLLNVRLLDCGDKSTLVLFAATRARQLEKK